MLPDSSSSILRAVPSIVLDQATPAGSQRSRSQAQSDAPSPIASHGSPGKVAKEISEFEKAAASIVPDVKVERPMPGDAEGDLPAKEDISVIIVGGTGDGKSSFSRWFCGIPLPAPGSDASDGHPFRVAATATSVTLQIVSNQRFLPHSPGHQQRMHTFSVIDTPGLGDVRGKWTDSENIVKLLLTLQQTQWGYTRLDERRRVNTGGTAENRKVGFHQIIRKKFPGVAQPPPCFFIDSHEHLYEPEHDDPKGEFAKVFDEEKRLLYEHLCRQKRNPFRPGKVKATDDTHVRARQQELTAQFKEALANVKDALEASEDDIAATLEVNDGV
eukprot:gene57047-biopygen103314